jgi:hypothetical protein
MRGQALVGGMQMCILGIRYIDAGLIQVAGFYVDLWQICGYARDALVLNKLCLLCTTVHKIMEYLHVRPDTTEMNQAALLYMHSYSTEHFCMK